MKINTNMEYLYFLKKYIFIDFSPFSYKTIKELVLELACSSVVWWLPPYETYCGTVLSFLKHHRRKPLFGSTFTERNLSFICHVILSPLENDLLNGLMTNLHMFLKTNFESLQFKCPFTHVVIELLVNYSIHRWRCTRYVYK